jgi:hypothetical protein
MPDLLEALVARVEPLDLALLVMDWLRAPTLAHRCSMVHAHKAYVAHHIPGHRVRIRVPHKKRDHAFFQNVHTTLNAIDGVKASVRPETGSILVHYQGDFSHLLLKVAEAGLDALIDLQTEPEPLEPLGNRLISQGVAFEKKLLDSTGGQMDGRSFALLALLLAAGLQIFRGQLFGPAVPLLWYTAEFIRNYLPKPSHQG